MRRKAGAEENESGVTPLVAHLSVVKVEYGSLPPNRAPPTNRSRCTRLPGFRASVRNIVEHGIKDRLDMHALGKLRPLLSFWYQKDRAARV